MVTIGIVCFALAFFLLYYLITFLNWLNQGWEVFSGHLIAVIILLGLFVLVLCATLLLNRWINQKVADQKKRVQSGSDGIITSPKAVQYSCNLLAIALLVHSAWSAYAIINTLNLMGTGGQLVELIDPSWKPWHFIPAILHVVLVAAGAIALIQRLAAAILFLGVALFLTLIGTVYQLVQNLEYLQMLGRILMNLTVTQVMPLAYLIFLLHHNKLKSRDISSSK